MSGALTLKRKRIEKINDLADLVHTMKALAASRISQYEDSVRALEGYYRTVILGLSICFGGQKRYADRPPEIESDPTVGAVVFGTDMGLVGQFNEALAGFTRETLKGFPGPKKIWAVGERLHPHLLDPDLPVVAVYRPPNSAKAITALVGRILAESRTETLYIFHNRPDTTALYRQVVQQLLPLDEKWIRAMAAQPWITGKLPEVLPPFEQTLAALISEFLFVSLFKACSQSMAAENTTRLHAMQRAEKNIEELLKDLQQDYHSQRQNAIDEELFDIISGFEALNI